MKVSIILTGKNDNYGGYFEERATLVTKYNLKRLKKINVDYELIFVEWNPDPTKQLFSQKFTEIDKNIKSYVVDGEIHDSIVGDYEYMEFLEFFAKNAGLKRATGDFIIFTNADVFFDDEIFENLKNLSNLNDKTIYRALRKDIKFDKLEGLGSRHFEEATFRINHCLHKPYTDASGDFTMAHKDLFFELNGYDENQKFVKIHKDTRILFSAFKKGDVDFEMIGSIYHVDHAGSAVGSSGDLGDYRKANGPYRWKYLSNLPYKNRKVWGLDQSFFDDVKLQENIYTIKKKKDVDLKQIFDYNDKPYMGFYTKEEFFSFFREIEQRYDVQIIKNFREG